MPMTPFQTLVIIVAIASGAVITRFLPFVVFPQSKTPPKIILQIGKMLPAAVMGLLVVYCLKGVSLFSGSYGIPELLAIAVILIMHKWKNNVLLSIGSGTVLYMVLVQFIFK